MARKISFVNVNRKCLKTTSVLILAKKIVQQGSNQKVLIVDAQGEITKILSRVKLKGSTESLLSGDCSDDLFEENAFFQIDVLKSPSDIDFVEFDTVKKYNEEWSKKKNELIKNKKDGADIGLSISEWNYIFKMRFKKDYYNLYQNIVKKYDDEYDYILFDTPSSIDSVTCSVINVSDSIIIPFVATESSERELIRLINSISSLKERFNPKVEIAGLLPVLVTKINENTTNKILLDIFRMISSNNIPFFSSQIPMSEKNRELKFLKHQINTRLNKTDKLSEAYDIFFNELIDKEIIYSK